MSKSVFKSIKPKSVRLVLNGKKTILESKTAPKMETPFKVYMYCTKEGKGNDLRLHVNDMKGRKDVGVTTWWRDRKAVLMVNEHLPKYRFNSYLAEGKVVAEFTCDEIIDYFPTYDKGKVTDYFITRKYPRDCLTKEERMKYGKGKRFYGLHVSDLKIYDQPKELCEFAYYCNTEKKQCGEGCKCYKCGHQVLSSVGVIDGNIQTEHYCEIELTRPPQSWCYVEER